MSRRCKCLFQSLLRTTTVNGCSEENIATDPITRYIDTDDEYVLARHLSTRDFSGCLYEEYWMTVHDLHHPFSFDVVLL